MIIYECVCVCVYVPVREYVCVGVFYDTYIVALSPNINV